MKRLKLNLQKEYRAALAYYKTTVWKHVQNIWLGGAQFHMAFLAWDRLFKAHYHWLESLKPGERAKARATEPDIETEFQPHRLERDNKIAPEVLATIASARLRKSKRTSVDSAIEEAHGILMASRAYLERLPEPKSELDRSFDANLDSTVSFEEILASLGKSDRVPLLPPVQKKRNNGTMTPAALKKALKDYAERQSEEIHQELRKAFETQEISCKRLEEIRWQRFRGHFKG